MILVGRLHVHRGLGGRQSTVATDALIGRRGPSVTGLNGVEIQPVGLVEPIRRRRSPLAVVANEVAAAAAVFQSLGHGHPDRLVFSRSRVAARKPDDGVVLVALAQEFAEDVGVLLVEHFFRMLIDVPRLGGNEPHDQAQFVRAVDHVVHVLEELLVGPGRVAVEERRRIEERRVAVRVLLAQSAQDIRLDDREAASITTWPAQTHVGGACSLLGSVLTLSYGS